MCNEVIKPWYLQNFVSYYTLIKNPTLKHQTNGYIMLLLYINVIQWYIITPKKE